MASYDIELTSRARRQLGALDRQARTRVAEAIDSLAEGPRPAGVVKVKTADEWRIRVGNYRVTFMVDAAARTVVVTWVGHRRDAYRDLS